MFPFSFLPFLSYSLRVKQSFFLCWKYYLDHIIKIYVLDSKFQSIIAFCHNYACGRHFLPNIIAKKVLDSGFYWFTLFYDTYIFYKNYEQCQRICNLTYRNEMIQTPILIVEICYVQDIYCFHSIMFLNMWKQRPLELTILRLLQVLLGLTSLPSLEYHE